MTRYCTACGHPTTPIDGTSHFECAGCGNTDYVNPAPAASVAIVRGDHVLLARRGSEPKKGEWDLVGGFVEVGETVPEAVRREALEETGLDLTGLRRLHQATGEYRPGEPTLNFIYVAEAEGEPAAHDDVAEVRWFALDDLPPIAWPHEAQALRRLASNH